MVWSGPQGGLRQLDARGEARARLSVRGGCDWGGYVAGQLGAMLLGCGRSRGPEYDEPLYSWVPGGALRQAASSAPAYVRGILDDGDRVWIASRRRRVEELYARPGLPATGRALAAPEGAVDRTWLHRSDDGELLVLDQYAGRVEVWSGDPPTLQRLIPVGISSVGPSWDGVRGAWIVSSGSSLLAVDPGEAEPVARWELPTPARAVLALASGDLAILVGDARPELWVLGAPGTAPRLRVRLPSTATSAILSLQP